MMSKSKKYITAASTFSVALGIGFVMQYGDAVASRWGADRPVAGPSTQEDMPDMVVVPVSASVAVPTTLTLPQATTRGIQNAAISVVPVDIEVPQFNLNDESTPALPPQVILAAVEDPLPPTIEMVDEDPVALVVDCDISLTATPAPKAMVALMLNSPCRPETSVAIHHQGMMFNGITDENGDMRVDVPALNAEAFFIAAFEDGEGAVAVTGVPEVAMYDRAVLQWQGEDDVQLHALEFGASYGDDGHIWANAIGPATDDGGFMTKLGQSELPNALMAEVYTYPTGLTARDGAIALSVEAEITQRNCGRHVEAQSIQLRPDSDAVTVDLAMTMPACDAVGDYLVLKNMLEDLTLAAK